MARRYRHDDDDNDVPIRTRPRSKPWVYPAVVGGTLAVLVLAVVVVGIIIAGRGNGSGEQASKDGVTPPTSNAKRAAQRQPQEDTPTKPTTRGRMPDPVPVIDPRQLVNPLARPQDVVLNPNPLESVEGINWTLDQLGHFLKAKGSITDYEIHERVSRRAPSSRFRDTPKRLMLASTKSGVTVEVTEWGGKIAAAEEAEACVDDLTKKSRATVAFWGKFLAEGLEIIGDSTVVAFSPLPGAKDIPTGESKKQKLARKNFEDDMRSLMGEDEYKKIFPPAKTPNR